MMSSDNTAPSGNLTASDKIMTSLATKPVDFRKGADGLAALVREEMRADPFSGTIYVFRANRAQLPAFCIRFSFCDGCLPLASAVRANVASVTVSPRRGVDVYLYERPDLCRELPNWMFDTILPLPVEDFCTAVLMADVDDGARDVILTIHWHGGQHSQVRVRKPKAGEHGQPEEALAIMRSMATRWSDADIAATLNRMGMQTGQGKTWTARRVQSLRTVHKINGYRSSRQERRVERV